MNSTTRIQRFAEKWIVAWISQLHPGCVVIALGLLAVLLGPKVVWSQASWANACGARLRCTN